MLQKKMKKNMNKHVVYLCMYIGVVDCNESGKNILHQDDLLRRLFRSHLE